MCETKTSKAGLGSVGNMGFGSLLLYTYPDGNNNRHHSNWSEERELEISHMYVWKCIRTKRKKKSIEEDREGSIFLLKFYF